MAAIAPCHRITASLTPNDHHHLSVCGPMTSAEPPNETRRANHRLWDSERWGPVAPPSTRNHRRLHPRSSHILHLAAKSWLGSARLGNAFALSRDPWQREFFFAILGIRPTLPAVSLLLIAARISSPLTHIACLHKVEPGINPSLTRPARHGRRMAPYNSSMPFRFELLSHRRQAPAGYLPPRPTALLRPPSSWRLGPKPASRD